METVRKLCVTLHFSRKYSKVFIRISKIEVWLSKKVKETLVFEKGMHTHKVQFWRTPLGPVVKTPHFHCRCVVSIISQETKIPHATRVQPKFFKKSIKVCICSMDAEKGHINEIVGSEGIDYNWAEFLRLNNYMTGQNTILGKTVLVGTMALHNTMLLGPWK